MNIPKSEIDTAASQLRSYDVNRPTEPEYLSALDVMAILVTLASIAGIIAVVWRLI